MITSRLCTVILDSGDHSGFCIIGNGYLSLITKPLDCCLAGRGLSTALFIMGRDAAVSFWQQHPDAFDAVLVEENGTVTITEGLEGLFTLTGGGTPEVVYA